MNSQIVDRIFMALLTLSMIGFAIWQPETSGFWFAYSSVVGTISLFVLGLLSLVALLDVGINDLMPDRFQFKFGCKMRQSLWMWIAITYLAYAFVNVKIGFELWLAAVYILCAARSALISVIDLQQSVNATRRDRRSTDVKAEIKGVP